MLVQLQLLRLPHQKNYFVYGLEKNHKESIRRIKSLNNSKFPFNTNDVKLKKH